MLNINLYCLNVSDLKLEHSRLISITGPIVKNLRKGHEIRDYLGKDNNYNYDIKSTSK